MHWLLPLDALQPHELRHSHALQTHTSGTGHFKIKFNVYAILWPDKYFFVDNNNCYFGLTWPMFRLKQNTLVIPVRHPTDQWIFIQNKVKAFIGYFDPVNKCFDDGNMKYLGLISQWFGSKRFNIRRTHRGCVHDSFVCDLHPPTDQCCRWVTKMFVGYFDLKNMRPFITLEIALDTLIQNVFLRWLYFFGAT